VGVLVGVNYILVRDLTSSFFPYEFFNALVALGLSSVDFWSVTSPLQCLIVVTFFIHWMIVGHHLYKGKRRWVSYQWMCFQVGVDCFFGLWERGGGFPSSGCDFWVNISCFFERGPTPYFFLGSSSL